MKIAIISTFLGQKISGAEISGFLLAKNLNGIEDVFVITTKVTKNMPFKTYSLPFMKFVPNIALLIGNSLTDKYIANKIYKILKKKRPDIVHVQDPSILIASVNAAKRLDIPIVETIRDYRFVCNLSTCLEENKIEFGCSKKQYKKCLYDSFREVYNLGSIGYLVFPLFYKQRNRLISYFKKVDYYITVSDFVKNMVVKAGIEKNKIKTIKVQKEGWDLIKVKESKEPRIFTAGGLRGTKGFDFLIKAFKEVVEKYPNAQLRIAGDGSAKNKLINLTKEIGISKNVKFLGYVNRETMKKEYANSNFVISPSLWPEPLTRIIFEAFSMRKPIIATNVGGSSELVKDGKTGLLVNVGDVNSMTNAIIKLIEKPSFRTKMGRYAYKLINEECNEKVVYKNHIEVYNEIIKRTIGTRKRI